MAQDLYDILEVPGNATDAWIRRAYEARADRIARDPQRTDEQRRLDKLALDEAFRTLGNPDRRAQYDARMNPPAPRNWGGLLLRGVFSPIGIGVLILAMAAGGYSLHQSRQERLRQEAEAARIAREADLARRELARRDEELRERMAAQEQRRQEALEEQQRRQFERDRRRLDSLQSPSQIAAQEEAARISIARQAQQQSEANQRREEAEARMRAREEERRRQQFLRERERKY